MLTIIIYYNSFWLHNSIIQNGVRTIIHWLFFVFVLVRVSRRCIEEKSAADIGDRMEDECGDGVGWRTDGEIYHRRRHACCRAACADINDTRCDDVSFTAFAGINDGVLARAPVRCRFRHSFYHTASSRRRVRRIR